MAYKKIAEGIEVDFDEDGNLNIRKENLDLEETKMTNTQPIKSMEPDEDEPDQCGREEFELDVEYGDTDPNLP